ncbi:MAG: ATP-binding protein [Actinomycetota bacterium]|nr:ATP-binding protein [Actinomycetota bacterium]
MSGCLLAGLALASLLLRRPADDGVADLQHTLLLVTIAVVGTLAGATCLLRHHVTGEAPLVWAGAGLLALAAVPLGAGDAPLLPAGGPDVAASLHAAGTLVAMVMFGLALRSPPVHAGLRPAAVTAGALVLTVLSTAALVEAPWLEQGWLRDLAYPDAGGGPLALPQAGFWLALTLAAARTARRDGRPALTWSSLVTASLALAAVVPSVTWALGGDPVRAHYLLQAGALLCALLGVQQGLVHTLGHHQAALFDTRLAAAAAEVSQQAERAALAERDHDLRSALFAIEGAARTLERHQFQLDEPARQALAQAVASEVARLQALVRRVDETTACVAFRVADAVAPVLTLEVTSGADLRAEIPEGLTAVGSPAATAEVLRNLLDNARRHAPGAAVRVQGERRDDQVVLRLQDEGAGVPQSERSVIFARAGRGAGSAGVEGSGLGLFVSSRLMREQGGALDLEDPPGGGAAFVLRLPAAAEAGR